MRDLSEIQHNPIMEEIVDIICKKVDNDDRSFFRVETAFFVAKMASSMWVSMQTKDRGRIPVNVYAMALGVSGIGKGFSVDVLENRFLAGFQQAFNEDAYPVISHDNMFQLASRKAARMSTDEQEELEKLQRENESYGGLVFGFDSGTAPAVKQYRQKLLLSGIGSINFQMDELGSNLESNGELMTLFLELYDQGKVKQKLVKNSSENKRGEELMGSTAANMFLFGTPSRVFDGGTVEDLFYKYLDEGYARRCLFAFGKRVRRSTTMTAKEIFYELSDEKMEERINFWSEQFAALACPANHGRILEVPDEVSIELIEYKLICEALADKMPEHEEIRRTEMRHRYFKALKIAGAFAFIEGYQTVTMEHLYQGIKLVEESGLAFQAVLERDKPYVRLAKYLAAVETEQTHADLHEALPFYKASVGARNEMMNMAMAWGYRQHIVITKTFMDGIEFYQGSSLKETDLEKVYVSFSQHVASGYNFEEAPWDALDNLLTLEGWNWCNHGFQNGHRSEANTVPGFNLLVLDIDGGTPLSTAQELLKDYTYIMYTTKRHVDGVVDHETKGPIIGHRFRIIIPMTYILELSKEDYDEFMNNVKEWLPFKMDEEANQRSRKWASYPGQVFRNEGILFDPLKLIPRTHKNEQYKTEFAQVKDLGNLERWFAQRMSPGNRNNLMHKFTMALVDSGFTYREVEQRVLYFNNQLGPLALAEDELRGSVLVTAAKKIKQ